MTGAPPELGAARRTLAAYRVAFAALAILVAVAFFRSSATSPSEVRGLKVVDVSARVALADRTRRDATDTVEWFFKSPEATVHMHALGAHQSCPLHIHRSSYEATLLLFGRAEVRHAFGDGGAQRVVTQARPGLLIESPPFCGHGWANVEPESVEANLVFESPPFDGNLYLTEAESRRANGPPPVVEDLVAELAEFAASQESQREKPLGLPGGRLAALFVRSDATVQGDAARTLVVYVVAGGGSVRDAAGDVARVAAGSLVLATRDAPLALHVDGPSALLVFHP